MQQRAVQRRGRNSTTASPRAAPDIEVSHEVLRHSPMRGVATEPHEDTATGVASYLRHTGFTPTHGAITPLAKQVTPRLGGTRSPKVSHAGSVVVASGAVLVATWAPALVASASHTPAINAALPCRPTRFMTDFACNVIVIGLTVLDAR